MNKLIEEFKFKSPKNLPPLCSLLSGFFSYDIIRYIEKIPNNCKDDLNLPDIRLIRPRSLIIYDNLKKNVHYIVNCYSDEKITNYQKRFLDIKLEIDKLKFLTIKNNYFPSNIPNKQKKSKVKSNIGKKYFKNIVLKAKKYIKNGDIFQVVLSQRFETKLNKSPIEIYKKLRILIHLHSCIFLILMISKLLVQARKYWSG